MTLREVQIASVRCVSEARLELRSKWTYLTGANGAGKTSILEAIYLLSRGRSFRTRQVKRLIQYGRSSLTVFGELAGAGVRRVGISVDAAGVERRIDGRVSPTNALLARAIPVHVIEPGSHALIEGGPSERRRFVDWGVFHVEPDYLGLWRDYRRVLGQRNVALKAAGDSELATWTQALAAAGVKVDAARRRYVEALRPWVERLGGSLLGTEMTVSYSPGWRAGIELGEAIHSAEGHDRKVGVTGPGPHRADLKIEIAGRLAAGEASRGQQKLAAAALTLGQIGVRGDLSGGSQALLIDDPASELDQGALARLMQSVEALDCQTVVTAITVDQLPTGGDWTAFHVEQGVVRAL